MATKIRDIITYYSEHEVSEELRERVLQRIASSSDDNETICALKDLWEKADSSFIKSEDIEKVYRDFSRRVELPQGRKETARRYRLLKIAAIVVPLLVFAAFALLYNNQNHLTASSLEVAMNQAYTTNEEEKTLLLPDSSFVKLSKSTVLLYPACFKEQKERKVFLYGEAYFDVKHNDKQPFRVSTTYFDITDLGTSFGITSYADKDEVSTTLLSGKIELRLTGSNRVYSMNPNDCLVYNVRTKQCRIKQLADVDKNNWKAVQIDLNDVSLLEASHILEQAYDVKFRFMSSRYKQTKITVHFNRGETLQKVMSVIAGLISGMEYQIQETTVTVK